MVCHGCGRPVEPGQRFCSGCGASLRGVTDRTEVVSVAPTAASQESALDAADPEWAPTGSLPTMPIAVADPPAGSPAATRSALDAIGDAPSGTLDAFDDVWAVTAESYPTSTVVPAAPPPTATATLPAIPVVSAVGPRFRLGGVTVAALAAATLGLLGTFATTVRVESDVTLTATDDAPAGFAIGSWMLDDLADNMSIAFLVAAVLLVAGGTAAGFRWRWGAGLAGGAGVATAGLAALAAGLADYPLDAARDFAATPNPQQFTLSLTRDVGYWLLVAAAAIGILTFLVAVGAAFGDRRRGLNPWIAALGALAAVVATIGPLLPEAGAEFSDNWFTTTRPGDPSTLLIAARLVQLGLLLATGVIGYLSVSRWGLGLAIGGALPPATLAITVLFGVGDAPVGPAFRNPGAVDADLHGVTIIGVSAIVAMAILALVAAYEQHAADRR